MEVMGSAIAGLGVVDYALPQQDRCICKSLLLNVRLRDSDATF